MAHSSAIWMSVTRTTSGQRSARSFLKIAPITSAGRSSGGARGADHRNEDRPQRAVPTVRRAELGVAGPGGAGSREYFACMLPQLRQGALEQEAPFVEKGHVRGQA